MLLRERGADRLVGFESSPYLSYGRGKTEQRQQKSESAKTLTFRFVIYLLP